MNTMKYQQRDRKRKEKKNQKEILELKITITEIKNSLKGLQNSMTFLETKVPCDLIK